MGFRTRPSSVAPWGAWALAAGVNNNETYQPTALTSDTQFIRGAISTDGALACSVSSTAITIIVNPVISTAISTSSQTVCLGDVPAPLSFTGAATGAGYTNQWFESNDNIVYNQLLGLLVQLMHQTLQLQLSIINYKQPIIMEQQHVQ